MSQTPSEDEYRTYIREDLTAMLTVIVLLIVYIYLFG